MQFVFAKFVDVSIFAIYAGKYCDIPLGLYVVRGDNIVLLGELDDAAAAEVGGLVEISPAECSELTASMVKSDAVLPWDFES
jgi:hypothetical protein